MAQKSAGFVTNEGVFSVRRLQRGPAPGFWTREQVKVWTRRWLDKVCEGHDWYWPQHKKKGINQHAYEAMEPWHHYKCAFCETPLWGTREIEHFWAKTKHPLAAFVWRNLFLICGDCNRAKGAEDHAGCLKPDREDPIDYLWVDPILLKMKPKPGISEGARQRAQRTIERYGLDRPELKKTCAMYLELVLHSVSLTDLISQTSPKVYLEPAKLQALAQPEKPFSLMAECLLKHYAKGANTLKEHNHVR